MFYSELGRQRKWVWACPMLSEPSNYCRFYLFNLSIYSSCAKCVYNFYSFQSFPSSATTLHFEFYDDNNKSDNKKSHLPTCIHIENVDKMELGCSANPDGTSAAEIMENIVENYAVPESKAMLLFTHVRLAHCFSNYQKRSQCVQARLQALSILGAWLY